MEILNGLTENEFQYTHAALKPETNVKWLDSGTGTLTVDAEHTNGRRTAQWIRDDNEATHKLSMAKNAEMDRKAVALTMGWETRGKLSSVPTFETPTWRDLDAIPKWLNPQLNRTVKDWRVDAGLVRDWRGFPRHDGDGKLPLHRAMMWANTLPDKSTGQIEVEMREADRRAYERSMDRSGPRER